MCGEPEGALAGSPKPKHEMMVLKSKTLKRDDE